MLPSTWDIHDRAGHTLRLRVHFYHLVLQAILSQESAVGGKAEYPDTSEMQPNTVAQAFSPSPWDGSRRIAVSLKLIWATLQTPA